MKKLLTTFFSIALSTAVLGAGNDGDNAGAEFAGGGVNIISSGKTNTFIETYDDGTDVGIWNCSLSVPRIIETSGGNPGAYVQQGGFSTHVPTWFSVSTRYQPGFNDMYKNDSIYTGDWTSLGVTSLTADLNIIQAGGWGPDRAVTLELLQMDDTGFNVNYDATYTLHDLPVPPVGWHTYSFRVDANSPTIPHGWVFTRGDGSPGTDAEWSPFLHRIDLTQPQRRHRLPHHDLRRRRTRHRGRLRRPGPESGVIGDQGSARVQRAVCHSLRQTFGSGAGADDLWSAGCRTQHARCVRSPLTAFAPQITINNEYATRAHGGSFTSKPHHKERKTKSNTTVESPRNDRATRLARWLQGRRRSRQKSRLLLTQRRH